MAGVTEADIGHGGMLSGWANHNSPWALERHTPAGAHAAEPQLRATAIISEDTSQCSSQIMAATQFC